MKEKKEKRAKEAWVRRVAYEYKAEAHCDQTRLLPSPPDGLWVVCPHCPPKLLLQSDLT